MADTARTTPDARSQPPSSNAEPPPAASGRPAAERVLADAKDIGAELLAAMRDAANAVFEQQRNRAADEIGALGEALRCAAPSLDRAGGRLAARYTEDASRQIGDFAATLRTRSWDELSGDLESFGRRWPLAFVASALGLGFAAGRVLTSSGTGEPAATGRRDDRSVVAAVSSSASADERLVPVEERR